MKYQNYHHHLQAQTAFILLAAFGWWYRPTAGFQFPYHRSSPPPSFLAPPHRHPSSQSPTFGLTLTTRRHVAASAASSFASSSDFDGSDKSYITSNNITLLTSILASSTNELQLLVDDGKREEESDPDQDRIDHKKLLQQERLARRQQQQTRTTTTTSTTTTATTYRVSLPLQSQGGRGALRGLCLCEVGPGRSVSQVQLELDQLQFVYLENSTTSIEQQASSSNRAAWGLDEINAHLSSLLGQEVETKKDRSSLLSSRSLMVTSVNRNSLAWEQGIRPGDVMLAMSATLGDQLWPKSTLEGVRSAISSRRVTSALIDMELRRHDGNDLSSSNSLVQQQQQQAKQDSSSQIYELTLTRPIGLLLQETPDGYVTVTGFTENAPTLVKYAVRVGDRVLAVDSSLGGRDRPLWPVSTVEGVISACTTRLPGQTIQMRLERPNSSSTSSTPAAAAAVVVEKSSSSSVAPASTTTTTTALDNKQLLKRCRDVLRRFAMIHEGGGAGGSEKHLLNFEVQSKFSGKYALPARVADKVVDALASASAAIDCVTLSMIMDAYLSCRQPKAALRIFEAATGFSADASTNPPFYHAVTSTTIEMDQDIANYNKIKKGIVPNEAALNLYTGTTLLKAHALLGDLASVQRVVAALEGRSGVVIGGDVGDGDGLESAPWPWTGAYGSIQLDTQFYNMVMAAAEKIGGPEALKVALEVFENRLAEPSTSFPSPTKVFNDKATMPRPLKDVVSFNTMISILSTEGRSDEAFRLLDQMKRSGIRPDKYTYTSLIKACANHDDIQEILYDMRALGVEPDCVTYNTMIKSLCEARRWTQATRLITEMESRGTTPDSMTYGYLMNAMLKTDKPNACLALFESACSSPKTAALTENIYLYTTAVTAASMLGDHERALELVSRMNAVGIKPNLKTLTAVIGACLSSGRADLASQLFKRIENPDGYAMAQGIQALCRNSQVSEAFALLKQQQRGVRAIMSGKDIMRSYHAVLKASFEKTDYGTARAALADLFQKGYIPSRSIVQLVVDNMRESNVPDANAVNSADVQEKNGIVDETSSNRDRFTFALYLMDCMLGRNLPVDGRLYSSTLSFAGQQKRGLYRKVASLMMQAKAPVGSSITSTKQMILSSTVAAAPEAMTKDAAVNNSVKIGGWEDLFLHYDSYKESLLSAAKGDDVALVLPALPVRFGSRDVTRVLRAEQSVTNLLPHSNRRKTQSRQQYQKKQTISATS